jgi:hypothetical protein
VTTPFKSSTFLIYNINLNVNSYCIMSLACKEVMFVVDSLLSLDLHIQYVTVNATCVTEVALVDVTSKFYHTCDDLKYSLQEAV